MPVSPLSVHNHQEAQEKNNSPVLSLETRHHGRRIELPGALCSSPERPPRSNDVQLRQHQTQTPTNLNKRNAMYNDSAPAAEQLPQSPVFTPPRLSQESDGTQPAVRSSLAQRRRGPRLIPFVSDMKTEMSFSLLQAKSEQQFVLSDYIDKRNLQYSGDVNDCKVKDQRFEDINTCKATQLFTSKGIGLPANQMKIDGENLAMRSQYPTTGNLGSHLSMLAEQKPAVLVILSSDEDIKSKELPAYFRETEGKHYNDAKYDKNLHNANKYDDIFVQCKKNMQLPVKMAGNLSVRNYRIEIMVNGKTTPISVMHVNNWEDRTTVDTKTLKALVSDINQKIDQKTKADSSYNPQPFIHCNAGIGRTGVVASAMELLKPGNNKTPVDIALQLRNTGCSAMVQTEAQFDTLVHLYDNLKSGH